jgi:hypothetical protein
VDDENDMITKGTRAGPQNLTRETT